MSGSLNTVRSNRREDIEALAGELGRLGIAERLVSCLLLADPHSRPDTGLWRAAVPYLAAMVLSVYGDGRPALDAVLEETGGSFVCGKVRCVLPDVLDDAAGAVIGECLIERFFEKVGMSKTNLAMF